MHLTAIRQTMEPFLCRGLVAVRKCIVGQIDIQDYRSIFLFLFFLLILIVLLFSVLLGRVFIRDMFTERYPCPLSCPCGHRICSRTRPGELVRRASNLSDLNPSLFDELKDKSAYPPTYRLLDRTLTQRNGERDADACTCGPWSWGSRQPEARGVPHTVSNISEPDVWCGDPQVFEHMLARALRRVPEVGAERQLPEAHPGAQREAQEVARVHSQPAQDARRESVDTRVACSGA